MKKCSVTRPRPIFDEAVVIIPTAAWHSDELKTFCKLQELPPVFGLAPLIRLTQESKLRGTPGFLVGMDCEDVSDFLELNDDFILSMKLSGLIKETPEWIELADLCEIGRDALRRVKGRERTRRWRRKKRNEERERAVSEAQS